MILGILTLKFHICPKQQTANYLEFAHDCTLPTIRTFVKYALGVYTRKLPSEKPKIKKNGTWKEDFSV